MIKRQLAILLIVFLVCNKALLQDTIWVDDFSKELGASWKGRCDNFEDIYTIAEEEASRFLKAESLNSDCFIIKKITVDIAEYPFLNWKWKAIQLPEEGDESVKNYCDVPASIAVVLNRSKLFPKSIKYSWSTSLAKDSITESPFAIWPASCDIHVLRSGEEDENKWYAEKLNVFEEYKNFSGDTNPKSKMVYAIVIMTDSDNTGTRSVAYYDDIYFSRN